MSNLVGIWDLESSDNFDAFLKSMGINFLLRKAAEAAKVTQILSINGDTWNLKIVAPLRSKQYDFKPGIPFEFEEGSSIIFKHPSSNHALMFHLYLAEFIEDKKSMVSRMLRNLWALLKLKAQKFV